MQTKRQTIIEISVNTFIGFIGSFIITYLILHLDLGAGLSASLVTIGCTIWSIIRQYFIRRYFNSKLLKESKHVN